MNFNKDNIKKLVENFVVKYNGREPMFEDDVYALLFKILMEVDFNERKVKMLFKRKTSKKE